MSKKLLRLAVILVLCFSAALVVMANNYQVSGMSFNGTMIGPGDTDWLDLQGQEGTHPTVCLNHNEGDDFDFQVYNDGQQVCQNISMDKNSCCSADTPGHVRVKVWSVRGSGPYVVTINQTNPAPQKDHEYNMEHHGYENQMEKHIQVSGMNYTGILSGPGDTNWLDLKGQEGVHPTICVSHTKGRDFDFQVYNNGNEVCQNVSASKNTCCTVEAPGRVSVKVWSVTGNGAYLLTIYPANR